MQPTTYLKPSTEIEATRWAFHIRVNTTIEAMFDQSDANPNRRIWSFVLNFWLRRLGRGGAKLGANMGTKATGMNASNASSERRAQAWNEKMSALHVFAKISIRNC